MINCETVLVLGAGSSMPYGYPSGKELVDRIHESIQNRSKAYQIVKLASRATDEELVTFAKRLRGSDLYSIDRFLADNFRSPNGDTEAEDPQVSIGKMFIAAVIRECDSADPFDHAKVQERNRGGNWLRLLFNKLRQKLHEADRDFESNRLSVVTFNYDMTFERYLNSRLKFWYPEGDNKLQERIRSIPVVHVYGKVRDHSLQASDLKFDPDDPAFGLPFDFDDDGHDDDVESLFEWLTEEWSFEAARIGKDAKEVDVIHEYRDLDQDELPEQISEARDLLKTADQVIFLGFGYDPMNLDILDVEAIVEQRTIGQFDTEPRDVGICGTSYGMGTAEEKEVHRHFKGRLSPSHTRNRITNLFPIGCYDFFREIDVIR